MGARLGGVGGGCVVWALDWVERAHLERVVVCSDSAAALGGLSGDSRVRPDLILELRMALHRIERAGGSVGLMWVPAHVGVEAVAQKGGMHYMRRIGAPRQGGEPKRCGENYFECAFSVFNSLYV